MRWRFRLILKVLSVRYFLSVNKPLLEHTGSSEVESEKSTFAVNDAWVHSLFVLLTYSFPTAPVQCAPPPTLPPPYRALPTRSPLAFLPTHYLSPPPCPLRGLSAPFTLHPHRAIPRSPRALSPSAPAVPVLPYPSVPHPVTCHVQFRRTVTVHKPVATNRTAAGPSMNITWSCHRPRERGTDIGNSLKTNCFVSIYLTEGLFSTSN